MVNYSHTLRVRPLIEFMRPLDLSYQLSKIASCGLRFAGGCWNVILNKHRDGLNTAMDLMPRGTELKNAAVILTIGTRNLAHEDWLRNDSAAAAVDSEYACILHLITPHHNTPYHAW